MDEKQSSSVNLDHIQQERGQRMGNEEKAAEKLRQLVNTNYTDEGLKIDISYDNSLSKSEKFKFV